MSSLTAVVVVAASAVLGQAEDRSTPEETRAKADALLKDFAQGCLGKWVSENKFERDGQAYTIRYEHECQWTPDKEAILSKDKWTIGGATGTSIALTGWNGKKQQLESHLFGSRGEYISSTSAKVGDSWVSEGTRVTRSGRTVTFKRTTTFRGKDSFTVKHCRKRDGEELPDIVWEFKRVKD